MEQESLSKVLSYAEENMSEGDYLKVAKALKTAYEMKDPEVLKVVNVPLNIKVRCKKENLVLYLSEFTDTVMKGDNPNKHVLKYCFIGDGQNLNKTVEWTGNMKQKFKSIVYNFLTLTNSMTVVVTYDYMNFDYSYKDTIENFKYEKEMQKEIEEWEDDDDEIYSTKETYHHTISYNVAELMERCWRDAF
jgi:hypothetical protein